jgi:hypothetical protein
MNPKLLTVAACGAALWLAAGAARARQSDAPPNGVDVLTRGPVHEAFAEPTDPTPTATPVVPQQPSATVPELPPDVRPEGDNVVWIPGYWSWDDESRSFLWVSGIWREVPPDRAWVSGYWQQVEGGWQWVPGYWAAQSVSDVEYLPQPPDPVPEAQPPAPDAASVYVPGIWMWRENNYYWRPGFYVPYQANWSYIPAHYVYSPYGYVFVEGYWDHPLADRGVLFAPVRFNPALMATANWSYVPQYVLSPDALMTSLFVRPAAYSYYFGDYFDARYSRGYIPWVDYRVSRVAFDPNFAYYAAAYQHSDPRWINGMRDLYVARREGAFPRPPRTWAEQTRFGSNLNAQNAAVLRSLNISNPRSLVQMAAPLSQVRDMRSELVRGRTAGANALRLQPLSQDQRAQARESVRQARELQQRRQQAEARLGAPARPGETPQQPRTTRLDLPRTTTSAGPSESGSAVPPRRQAPPLPQRPSVYERPGLPERSPTQGRPETARPGVPQRPATPERPPAPERPSTPGRPGVPERPGSPERPGAAERPGIPGTPGVPERPGTPPPSVASERPGVPGTPGVPQRPSTPGRPGVPDRPGVPERPNVSERPAVTGRPGVPETPGAVPPTPRSEPRSTPPGERPVTPGRPTPPERPAIPGQPPVSPRPQPTERPTPPPAQRPPEKPQPPERPTPPPAQRPPERPVPPAGPGTTRPDQKPPTPPKRPEPPGGERLDRPDRERPLDGA